MEEQEKAGTQRQYLEICAIDPISGKTTQPIQISYNRLHNIKKKGIGEVKCAGFTVPYILQHPTQIFEGLCLEVDEDARGYGWRCYCGIPKCDYSVDGKELDPRNNRVFLVFVNAENVAYNWRWEKCDPTDDKLPINYKTRFKKGLL